jgi:tetratricopeptide (TPR) repeat protein
VWGRCWEAGGAPAYWPWAQVVRALRRDADGPADLADLLPGLGPREEADAEADPGHARFLLFDGVLAVLDGAAAARPLLLILDDLHAADRPSLLLLRYVAGEVASRPILVVGAFRDLEVGPDHPLAGDLSELGRVPGVLRMTLAGLGRSDVARLLESAGADAFEAMSDPIHRETGGNPLYVAEVVRLLDAEGRLDAPTSALKSHGALPRSLRDAIDRRLVRLPEGCRATLSLASVLGREFDVDDLVRLADRPEEDVLDSLEAAMAGRLVGAVPGGPGSLRFSHALVRDALYEELTPLRRARLHRRAGEVIEAAGGGRDARLAELAHHFSCAALAGGSAPALGYARRAGERALAGLAYEEAARLFELALSMLEPRGPREERLRCELLLVLGEAHAQAGDGAAAREVFRRAAELAQAAGWSEALGAAALGYGGRFVWAPSLGDPVTARLLEAALAALGEEDGALRARLLARLAAVLRDRPEREPRYSIAAQAVAVARRIGDPATLAYVLDGALAATWGPDDPEARISAATEIVDLAERVEDRERALQGHLYRLLAWLELGDMRAVRAELGRTVGIGGQLRQPAHAGYVTVVEFILAIFEGRFAEARELLGLARMGRRSSLPFGSGSFWEVVLRRQVGPLEGLDALADAAREEFPTVSLFACQAPVIYAELGRREAARDALLALAAEGFDGLRVENDRIPCLTLLAEACAAAEERSPAAELYDRLLPYAERNAVWHPAGATGSVARPLGMLAALCGRPDEAVAHLEAAVAANLRQGARPWAAHAEVELACVLRRRDGPGDEERARELVGRAASTAERLGMAPLAARIAALPGPGPRPAGGVRMTTTAALLRREGEYWSVGWDGSIVRIRDSKGLRYLGHLLAAPGREVHALELVALERGAEPGARGISAATADGEPLGRAGPGEPVVDAEARAAYRARLAELEEELEIARSWGDPERAARAAEERDALVDHLAGALGLGGRPRTLATDAERARVSVTRAIRAALGRLGAESAELGRHLERSVRTGTTCSYRPDPRAPVDWRL